MDFDSLTDAYWQRQTDRIIKVCNRISQLGRPALPGRVIPEEDDLAIGTGRRLKCAVLFTDISGFSARPASTDDEQNVLLHILNLFFTEMIRVAEDHGGTVEKNTGDGLMAYFEDNAGAPSEGGTKRALAAALTMMCVNAKAINPLLRHSGLEEISFRVGIDYGPVTIARLGAAGRFGGLVAIGTTANIACKILKHAQKEEILLGEDAYKQLPLEWKNTFAHCALEQTGFIYRHRGTGFEWPYKYFRYTGRWKRQLT